QGQDLVGPAADLGAQLGRGHHAVHEPPALGRLGVVAPAEEPDLAGALLADHSGQVGGPEAGVEGAHPGAYLAEYRVLDGDRQVTEQVQHVTAADRVAVHRRDHRHGHLPAQPVQVLDLEQPGLGRAIVAGLGLLLLAAARRVGPLLRAGAADYGP